ncbi:hypothetical protein EV682_10241 [Iodobacter fluviatilis]|uniref:Uncharacterized protein n=1 Tax=Iodobacter fluviatilis TaxID=537 RepID=A0A377Q701_9NEIS|nr:hypothetical protein EV682_10241 [Iodobacter fluviatilis]STQ90500.1 Uncharacterised protein [Iodobacter fluviatilis]
MRLCLLGMKLSQAHHLPCIYLVFSVLREVLRAMRLMVLFEQHKTEASWLGLGKCWHLAPWQAKAVAD